MVLCCIQLVVAGIGWLVDLIVIILWFVSLVAFG